MSVPLDVNCSATRCETKAFATYYDLVRMCVASLLIAAAVLKAHELATRPTSDATLLTSRWFLIGLVELEFALGVLLVCNRWPVLLWRITIGAFSCFAAVSLSRGLLGYESCGSFGQLMISPWITLVLDIVVTMALWRWMPSQQSTSRIAPHWGVQTQLIFTKKLCVPVLRTTL